LSNPASDENAPPFAPAADPAAIGTALLEWHDTARDRHVPAKLYYPVGEPPYPVVIFSHGLGGSRQGYAYLGRYWAACGYVALHVQHRGSDSSLWQNREAPMKAMRAAASDVQNALDRPADIHFALDQLAALQASDETLAGRLDLDRIGVSGHSFGAYTTLAVAGQTWLHPTMGQRNFGDPRVKAAVAMSPSAPRQRDDLDRIYARIRIPLLYLTGTLDKSPIRTMSIADRRIPFDNIRGVDQYLVIFEGGDHMVFSDHKRIMGGGANEALFHPLICQATTAFWHTYLRGDGAARRWLTDGGFGRHLGPLGTLETKSADD